MDVVPRSTHVSARTAAHATPRGTFRLGSSPDLGSARGPPKSAGRLAMSHTGRDPPDRRKKERTVAIVEDQTDSLLAYSGYLRRHGYHSVFTFATGEAFERAVEDGSVSPELMLVDYRLPGKNGIEIAREAAKRRPEVKVIVTTADDSLRTKADSLGFLFLQKPFSLAALAKMMDGLE